MPQSLPDTTPPKRRFRWPTGMPQLAALLLVLLVDSPVAPAFLAGGARDGRLFGSPIDILNRAAPRCAVGYRNDAGDRNRWD